MGGLLPGRGTSSNFSTEDLSRRRDSGWWLLNPDNSAQEAGREDEGDEVPTKMKKADGSGTVITISWKAV